MINKLKRNYHKLMMNYNNQLHNDCLNIEMKNRYYQKAMQHNIKFVELI